MKKRILSLLLTLVMILGMIPATTLTANAEELGTITNLHRGTFENGEDPRYIYWDDSPTSHLQVEIYRDGTSIYSGCALYSTGYIDWLNLIGVSLGGGDAAPAGNYEIRVTGVYMHGDVYVPVTSTAAITFKSTYQLNYSSAYYFYMPIVLNNGDSFNIDMHVTQYGRHIEDIVEIVILNDSDERNWANITEKEGKFYLTGTLPSDVVGRESFSLYIKTSDNGDGFYGDITLSVRDKNGLTENQTLVSKLWIDDAGWHIPEYWEVWKGQSVTNISKLEILQYMDKRTEVSGTQSSDGDQYIGKYVYYKTSASGGRLYSVDTGEEIPNNKTILVGRYQYRFDILAQTHYDFMPDAKAYIGDTEIEATEDYYGGYNHLLFNGPIIYVYDVKPEIHSVSVNGTSVADGASYNSNSKNVTIKTTYDSTLSAAMLEYGCTSVKKFSQWYLNGEKLNIAATTPVDNGNGTSSDTYYRTLNDGDVLEIRNWLEVTWPDGTTDIVDEHTMTVTGPISEVNVGATWSGTPANATSNTDGITVTGTQWYRQNGSTWTALTSSDTIKEGYTYRCEVTVAATDGYTLADGYTVKINGTAATKLSGNTWYVDKTIAGILPLIDVMDIYLPEAGITPDFTCTWDDYSYDDEIYEVEKIEWFKSNASGSILSDALPADYVFEEDSYYLLKVTIKPKDGWILYQTGFYINGEKVENDGESGTIGKIVYHTSDAYSKYTVKIDDVTMKDGDYLALGATDVTTAKPSGGYAHYKDGVLTLNDWNDGNYWRTEKSLIEFSQRHLKVNLVGDNWIGMIQDKNGVYDDEVDPYWLTIDGDGSLTFTCDGGYECIAVDGTVSFNGGYIELTSELWCVTKVKRIEINGADVYFNTAQDGFSRDDSVDMVVYDGTFRAFDAGSYAGDEWLNINFLDESAYRVYAGSSTGISNPREVQPDQLEVWTGTDFTSFNSYDLVMAAVVSTHTVTVSGTVTSFNSNTDTVTIQLIEEGHTEVAYEVTTTGNSATYSITDVVAGTYTMKVSKNNHVTREYTVTVGSTAVTQDAKIHLLGDVNGDGRVRSNDLTIVYNHVNGSATITDEYIFNCADVTGDGRIRSNDVTRIFGHVNGSSKLW